MAFINFHISQRSGASDSNGGGPRLGLDDGPVLTYSNVTFSVNSSGVGTLSRTGGFYSTFTGDWGCLSKDDTRYLVKVYTAGYSIALDGYYYPGTLPWSDTGYTLKIGGAWNSFKTARNLLNTKTTSGAECNIPYLWYYFGWKYSPRLNIRAGNYEMTADEASAISELWTGYTGTPEQSTGRYSRYGLTIEGFKDSFGDLRWEDVKTTELFPKITVANSEINSLGTMFDLNSGVCLRNLTISRPEANISGATVPEVVAVKLNGEATTIDRCQILTNGNIHAFAGPVYPVLVAGTSSSDTQRVIGSQITRQGSASYYPADSHGVALASGAQNVVIMNNSIKGPGQDEDNTTITADKFNCGIANIFNTRSHNVEIFNNEIYYNHVGIRVGGRQWSIVHNTVTHNKYRNVCYETGDNWYTYQQLNCEQLASSLIINNVIANLYDTWNGWGIAPFYCTYPGRNLKTDNIDFNVFQNNGAGAMDAGDYDYHNDEGVADSAGSVLTDGTKSWRTDQWRGFLLYFNSTDYTILRNTGTQITVQGTLGTYTGYDYNVHNPHSGFNITGDGNIMLMSTDSLFVDADNEDFRLAQDCPARKGSLFPGRDPGAWQS
jgi:hypothetical protein